MEKLVELSLYLVIIAILVNVIFSIVTFGQIKTKSGEIGNPGIRGQVGDKGYKGECSSDCGTKVCFSDLQKIANDTFYEELEKIYGSVMLKYDYDADKDKIVNYIWNKIFNEHADLLVKKENKDKFNALSKKERKKVVSENLNIYATTDKQNTQIYVRIHGGDLLGEKLRDLLDNSGNEYLKYRDLIPIVVNKEDEIDEIASCLSTEEEDINEEIKEILLEPKRRKELIKMKIRNSYFINKLAKICESPEYQETLELEIKNKPNERKLIDYLKTVIRNWVQVIMKFTYLREEEKLQKHVISYGGMRFLSTREADINTFSQYLSGDIYKNNYNKIQIKLLNPLTELSKYDVWNWNEIYIKSPLVFEKCSNKIDLPQGKEPILYKVLTNNYEKIYDSETNKNKWFSNDNFCAFNQMGENLENEANIKQCTSLKTNDQGHDYLRGTQTAWENITYGKPKKLALYHPKKLYSDAYFKDEYGKKYYPVGSVWSAQIIDEREDKNMFYPKSKDTYTGNLGNGPEKETILVSGDVADPVDYVKIWNNKGDEEGCIDCQDNEVTIWRPIPPSGYVCLGDVVAPGKQKPVDYIKCVPKKTISKIHLGQKVWDSTRLYKLIFGKDDTTLENAFEPADLFYINLYQYISNLNLHSLSNTQYILKNDLLEIIDKMISKEKKQKSIEKKNTNYYKNPYLSDINIKKLNSFKKSKILLSWPFVTRSDYNKIYNKRKEIFNLKGELTIAIDNIYKKYSDRYYYYKDLELDEIENDTTEIGGEDLLLFGTEKDCNERCSRCRSGSSRLIGGKCTDYCSRWRYCGKSHAYRYKGTDCRKCLSNHLTISNKSIKKPIIIKSKPLNIYSAGAQNASIENDFRKDLNIIDDGGYNLFLADNESNIQKPLTAYKIKKSVFIKQKGLSIENNSVEGTLDYLERKNKNRKSSSYYFSFPLNLIVESNFDKSKSPNGESKKFYLTLVKEVEENDERIPIYIIRAINTKTNKFSNCLNITEDKKIVITEINTSNKNNLWTVKNINSSDSDIVSNAYKKVTINILSYKFRDYCFSHEYNDFNLPLLNATTKLSDNKCKWTSLPITD